MESEFALNARHGLLREYLERTERATLNRGRGKGELIDRLDLPAIARALLRAVFYPTSGRDRVLVLGWLREQNWVREYMPVEPSVLEPFRAALDMLLALDLVVVRSGSKGPALFANHHRVKRLFEGK